MKIKRGPFKGKTIEFAPTNRIENTRAVADEFMFEIFDFDAGEYLITDESSLSDFTEFGSLDTTPIWRKIEDNYGISPDQLKSDLLVDIFEEIVTRRNIH
jgi:hypothetical protein